MEHNKNLPATGVLSLFASSKEDRRAFASQVVHSILEGEVNALDVHLKVKYMEDTLEAIKEDKAYRKECIEAAQRVLGGVKETVYYGAKIKVNEVGVKYDYSVCNDPVMNELLEQQKELAEAVKERGQFLQKIPLAGLETVNEDTGEVYTIYPPSKSSTTSVIVELPK